MKTLVVIVLTLVALLVVFVGPVDAKRGGGGGEGCSTEDWHIVLDTERARLCLLARPDR